MEMVLFVGYSMSVMGNDYSQIDKKIHAVAPIDPASIQVEMVNDLLHLGQAQDSKC